jgi:hypothetical protein
MYAPYRSNYPCAICYGYSALHPLNYRGLLPRSRSVHREGKLSTSTVDRCVRPP